MDYLVEGIALGVDFVIFMVCIKQYYKNKKAVTLIQGAPYLFINNDLKDIVETHPEKRLSYVSVRGTIKAIGKPIISNNNPNVTGVIQLLTLKEHVHHRTTGGFWSESERTLQEIHNVIPFALVNKGIKIEIVDPLAAEILDMDTISDVFKPTNPSVMDHIWGFFSGIRQHGIQSTEKMLREGSVITGIGELMYSNDCQTLKLQPPINGAPFYLTNMQVTSLVKKLGNSKRKYRILCIIFAMIGVTLSGFIYYKFKKFNEVLIKNEERKRKVEEIRKKRRRLLRDGNLQKNQICVVCQTNPIEIILLPCGHVCLCEDCASDISISCPICRTPIENKNVAYVA